jgi:hypothetical protein
VVIPFYVSLCLHILFFFLSIYIFFSSHSFSFLLSFSPFHPLFLTVFCSFFYLSHLSFFFSFYHSFCHIFSLSFSHSFCCFLSLDIPSIFYIYIYIDFFRILKCSSFVTSWIDKRELDSEKANLTILFDKYVPACLEVCRTRFKKITPIADISHIQMLCYLLECLLTPTNVPIGCPKEWYERYFVFACVWAFGAAMFQDQVSEIRYHKNL